ncbi:hypothetical protein L9F63_008013, partial [Diploptera punctata]
EEEESGTSMAEQDFKFMDFLKRFAHHKVVMACSLLLRQFDRNLLHTNHCIIKLLHRIAWDCKMPAMLFQASLFQTFQRILDSKLDHHKELAKFAVFIIRKFTEVAQKNGKVYMELLFWKTMRDAYEIEEGYGSYQEKSHSSKNVWTEEEEEELRRLYEEFTRRSNMEDGENDVGTDVVDWIVQNLINTTRSHRGIAKKLRELGYEVATKVTLNRSFPKQEWAEEEEQQFERMYEKISGLSDPLGCIVDRLTVRRPKQRIADKLLEMGLVQDKKELRKKRVGKQRAPGGRSEESENSSNDDDANESSDDSGSDGDGRPSTSAPKPAQRRGQGSSVKRTAGSKKTSAKRYSSTELTNLLIQVTSAGMSEALQWLCSCLEEVADDRETDGDEENIPLLPLTEETMTAMDNSQFQELLRATGISPPFDEQEVYWRIPGHMSVQELRKRIEVITQALEGRLVAPPNNEEDVDSESTQNNIEIPSTSHSTQDYSEATSEQISQNSVSKKKKHKEKKNNDKLDKNMTNKSSGKKQSRKKVQMGSESETEEASINVLEEASEETISRSRKNKNTLLDSDSETEEASLSLLARENDISQTNRTKSRIVLNDSESETEMNISLLGGEKNSSQTTKNWS